MLVHKIDSKNQVCMFFFCVDACKKYFTYYPRMFPGLAKLFQDLVAIHTLTLQ